MCGIVGGFSKKKCFNPSIISQTLDTLYHRGPDDRGYLDCGSQNTSGFLGHTRLSVIDLSYGGQQPLSSSDGRYHLVFNGEIYNYLELKKALKQAGFIFRTQTDTEVLLNAWVYWGEKALKKCIGMFAFVIYDKKNETLTCIRDAFGIKPFFYQVNDNTFIFASETKAVRYLSQEENRPNWTRVYQYLLYGRYDNREDTFYKNIQQLLPACGLVYDINKQKITKKFRWWVPSIKEDHQISYQEAVSEVRASFLSNVKLHMRSDVPLGAALSGGIDSSAIVSAIRYHEPDRPIHTFSFIAKNEILSEEKWIDYVNEKKACQAHKIVLSGEALAKDIDSLIDAQGEPFMSTSIYAQYAVFKKAKEAGMKVILDGQGADEILAGYRGYPGYRLMSLIETGKLMEACQFASKWAKWPNRRYHQAWVHFLSVLIPMNVYSSLFSMYHHTHKVSWLNNDFIQSHVLSKSVQCDRMLETIRGRRVVKTLAGSLQYFGLPSLLRHADRNAMHFSIENRVPFLTTSFVDMALSLPEGYLISPHGETKHIFRDAMRGIVPDEILNRKDKIGFESPEKKWLFDIAHQVRGWLEETKDIPIFNHTPLVNMVEGVLSGKRPYTSVVWRVLNLIRWLRNE